MTDSNSSTRRSPKIMKVPKPKSEVTPKTPKSKGLKPWVSYTPKEYEVAFMSMVHLTGSTVDTNSAECGVRLQAEAVDLPYVSVSTLGGSAVPFDYAKQKSNIAGITAQVNAVVGGCPDTKYSAVAQQDVQVILGIYEAFSTAGAAPVRVDARLRQVLVPTQTAGEYMALTPLQSTGLSALLKQKLADERALAIRSQRHVYRDRAYIGLGGSYPVNAGVTTQVIAAREPLVFWPPVTDIDLRAAYAIRHRGVSLVPSKESVRAYANWLTARQNTAKWLETLPEGDERKVGISINQRRTKNQDVEFLGDIVASVLQRVSESQEKLNASGLFDGMPSDELKTSDELVYQSLVPDARTAKWASQLATRILKILGRQPEFEAYSGAVLESLQPKVETLIRNYSHG